MFSTNPYGKFHDPGSKEFIQLNSAATTGFNPTRRFNLAPDNSEAFTADLEKYSKQFCYNLTLSRVATTATVDEDDGTVTLGGHKNMLKTYHEVSEDAVISNANMTWGDLAWLRPADQEIQQFTVARGELTGAFCISSFKSSGPTSTLTCSKNLPKQSSSSRPILHTTYLSSYRNSLMGSSKHPLLSMLSSSSSAQPWQKLRIWNPRTVLTNEEGPIPIQRSTLWPLGAFCTLLQMYRGMVRRTIGVPRITIAAE